MELARVRFADAKVDDLLATMNREHAVIVEGVLSPDCVAQVLEELEPFIAGTEPIDDDFVGKATTRTGALVTRSPASREAIAHPLVLEVANAFLSEFASNIQLNLTQIMRILPGEKAQGLHRDRYLWSRSLPPEVEPMFNCMWALTDFTEASGATRVVPGSQAWDWARSLEGVDSIPAEMPAGSVLLYSGSIVHGGGANRAGVPRVGMSITYLLSWLRQEENQYLSCPPEVARTLSSELQGLLGYTIGNGSLGYFSPSRPAQGHPDTLPPEVALGTSRRGEIEEQKPF
ncbi:MAG: phytanoyl-CoA dioxygenase family protein [Myxococcota bacterium]